jgi:ABC-type polysaccharide/polyol phosphate export permease
MRSHVDIPESPPPELRFRRRVEPLAAVRELWQARHLIRSLAERQLKARYKQALLGFGWALITPLALMVVFTVFVDRVARVNTGGVPYPLFAYVGVLPWSFFSSSVNNSASSLLSNIQLLQKMYCPREVFPLSTVVVASADSAVSLVPLVGLFFIHGFAPKATTAWVPLLFLVQIVFTLGVAMMISVVVVYLRDLRHALSLLLQLGLFATPVAYGLEAVPASLHRLYAALNPLAPVIDGYRRSVLLGEVPNLDLLAVGAVSAVAVLFVGYLLFKRLEAGIVDVA